jgi:hypothetical protein
MLSYYAWTLPHSHFFIFLHIPFYRTSTTSTLVFRIWERPDWVCVGDAQSLPLPRGQQNHTVEPLDLSPLHSVRPKEWLTCGRP